MAEIDADNKLSDDYRQRRMTNSYAQSAISSRSSSIRCSRYRSSSSTGNCARNSGLADVFISIIKSMISLLPMNPTPILKCYRCPY